MPIMQVTPLTDVELRRGYRSRKRAPFRAPWGDTVETLHRELKFLQAKHPELRIDVRPQDIRNDGWIRSTACADHPAVQVAMETKYGHLVYSCSKFSHWEDNVRAIALTLERLRKAELYGCTKRGEQYTGFQALPAPANHDMTVQTAIHVIGQYADNNNSPADYNVYKIARREAMKNSHPDSIGGTKEDFQKVQAACEVMDKHFKG